ncbi:hypothetical protein G9A89_023326 [Geosiphon pyriformis]|nr:hypothetical protein G9A89_023326 [Geosiphon pyriformis]
MIVVNFWIWVPMSKLRAEYKKSGLIRDADAEFVDVGGVSGVVFGELPGIGSFGVGHLSYFGPRQACLYESTSGWLVTCRKRAYSKLHFVKA